MNHKSNVFKRLTILLIITFLSLIFIPNVFATTQPIFYQSLDDANALSATYNCAINPITGEVYCDPAFFVDGIKRNGVFFDYTTGTRTLTSWGGISFPDRNYGTVEYWVKPNTHYIYNPDLYFNGIKLGSSKFSNGSRVTFLLQQYHVNIRFHNDFLISVPQTSTGWHKAVLTWNCYNNGQIDYYIDNLLVKTKYDTSTCKYFAPSYMRIGGGKQF